MLLWLRYLKQLEMACAEMPPGGAAGVKTICKCLHFVFKLISDSETIFCYKKLVKFIYIIIIMLTKTQE